MCYAAKISEFPQRLAAESMRGAVGQQLWVGFSQGKSKWQALPGRAFDHDMHLDDVDECVVDGIDDDWCLPPAALLSLPPFLLFLSLSLSHGWS